MGSESERNTDLGGPFRRTPSNSLSGGNESGERAGLTSMLYLGIIEDYTTGQALFLLIWVIAWVLAAISIVPLCIALLFERTRRIAWLIIRIEVLVILAYFFFIRLLPNPRQPDRKVPPEVQAMYDMKAIALYCIRHEVEHGAYPRAWDDLTEYIKVKDIEKWASDPKYALNTNLTVEPSQDQVFLYYDYVNKSGSIRALLLSGEIVSLSPDELNHKLRKHADAQPPAPGDAGEAAASGP